MKQYFHSGLQEIAQAAGFKASTCTLRALQACSHYKRTHIFLLNVWKAMYQQMLCTSSLLDSTDTQSILNAHTLCVESILKSSNCYAKFEEYVRKQGEVDMTFKYWSDFVLVDLCIYTAISGYTQWKLESKSSCYKKMASIFDQETCMKIIPSHLLYRYITTLSSGSFTVSLTRKPWNNGASHEMKINKDLKSAVVRPTAEYLQKLSLFLITA